MTDHTDINLGGVQKTLLLPLWGRTLETKKDNPLVLGQTAVEIITYLQLGTGQ